MTTLQDISRRTGVSANTVSAILRGKAGYSPETRQRVLAVAEALDYRSNPIGRALRSGRSMAIGILDGAGTDQAAAERSSAARHAARQAGYVAYAADIRASADDDECLEMVREMLSRRVDGLIVQQPRLLSSQALAVIQQHKTPMVFVRWAPPGAWHHVAVDLGPALRDLAEHLRDGGHRSALYIPATSSLAKPQFKLDDYRRAFEAAGLRFDVRPEWHIFSTRDSGRQAYDVVRQIAQAGPLPSALLMSNDLAAMGALAALQDLKVPVPGRVSVVGFNDDPQAELHRPSLTTIRVPNTEAGAAGFQMLLRMMQDPQLQPEPVRLACELVIRQSTGDAPKGDPLTSTSPLTRRRPKATSGASHARHNKTKTTA